MKSQPHSVGRHSAEPNSEGSVPTEYMIHGVPTLQDQADNGGWLPHAQPIHTDPPKLQTMGTR